MDFEKIKNIIRSASREGEDCIEFHGSEPTIHPEFLQICELIKDLDMKLQLATNCRMFYYKKFTKTLNNYNLSYVYTSCHSHIPQIHDWLTRVRGSFKQTIAGIKNILEYKIPIEVNIVILKKNINELSKWVEFMNKIGVSKIRFSFPEIEGSFLKNFNLVPRLSITRKHLQEAVHIAESLDMKFSFEKGPVCLAPKYHDLFMYQPYIIKSHKKGAKCNKCSFNDKCVGVHKNYGNVYKKWEKELSLQEVKI